jgi:hypothetical protein
VRVSRVASQRRAARIHKDGSKVASAVALFATALLASGCMTKVVKLPVFDENDVEVFLRYESKGGKPIDRGFSHPVVVAPVRLTNLLARIEVRKGDKPERQPAIPTELLYPIGDGIARALAKADPSQEVVVMATERKRNLAVFTQDHLTSLIVWNIDDKLFVKLGHLDWAVPKDSKDAKGDKDSMPEPKVDEIVGKTRAVPSEGIAAEGNQLVTANWRDPIFKDSGALHVRPGGQVVRRTVLMDSGEEVTLPVEPTTGAPVPPQGVSPEGLRALADLEESRRRGELTEGDYQAKRRQILAGEEPAPTSAPAATTPPQ